MRRSRNRSRRSARPCDEARLAPGAGAVRAGAGPAGRDTDRHDPRLLPVAAPPLPPRGRDQPALPARRGGRGAAAAGGGAGGRAGRRGARRARPRRRGAAGGGVRQPGVAARRAAGPDGLAHRSPAAAAPECPAPGTGRLGAGRGGAAARRRRLARRGRDAPGRAADPRPRHAEGEGVRSGDGRMARRDTAGARRALGLVAGRPAHARGDAPRRLRLRRESPARAAPRAGRGHRSGAGPRARRARPAPGGPARRGVVGAARPRLPGAAALRGPQARGRAARLRRHDRPHGDAAPRPGRSLGALQARRRPRPPPARRGAGHLPRAVADRARAHGGVLRGHRSRDGGRAAPHLLRRGRSQAEHLLVPGC